MTIWCEYQEDNYLHKCLWATTKGIITSLIRYQQGHSYTIDKVKFKSFGKVTLAEKKVKNDRKVEKREEADEDKARELLKKQVKDTEEEIKDIEEHHKGTVGRIYELRKRVNGVKKQSMMPTAILNPKTKKLSVSKEEIKQVILQ